MDLPFEVKQPDEHFFDEGDIGEPEGLINVTAIGFFEALIQTLNKTYLSLEG